MKKQKNEKIKIAKTETIQNRELTTTESGGSINRKALAKPERCYYYFILWQLFCVKNKVL